MRRTLEKELTRAILAGELADGSTIRASVSSDASEGDTAIVLDTISAPAIEPEPEPARV